MKEKEIFEELFKVAATSKDPRGVVSACLVRNDEIILAAASSDDGKFHAEYVLVKKMQKQNIKALSEDILYCTMQPCGLRNLHGPGADLVDCTTAILGLGIRNVVYGLADPEGAMDSAGRFVTVGASLEQIDDVEIIERCREIYNSTLTAPGMEERKL